jgi:hypothetical protein
MGYKLIETVTVGSGGAASIEFTGIPQDGVDLLVLLSARSNSQSIHLNLNGSATGFTGIRLTGTGSSALSSAESTQIGYVAYSAQTANTFGNASIYVSNYTSSQNKSISIDSVNENNASAAIQNLNATTWANTSAITALWLGRTSFNLEQYTTASLYKITAD